MTELLQSNRDILRWMKEHAEEYLDCGEVNMTKLAEAAVDEFNEWGRLDDPDDSIWNLAFRTATWWENQQSVYQPHR